jgi:hypothetical protein
MVDFETWLDDVNAVPFKFPLYPPEADEVSIPKKREWAVGCGPVAIGWYPYDPGLGWQRVFYLWIGRFMVAVGRADG